MGKIAVYVQLAAVAGKGAELVEAFQSLYTGPLDAEPGTVVHVIHQVEGEPDRVMFYELYDDDAALKAHNAGEALKSVLPKLAGLVAGRPEVTRLEVRNAKGVEL